MEGYPEKGVASTAGEGDDRVRRDPEIVAVRAVNIYLNKQSTSYSLPPSLLPSHARKSALGSFGQSVRSDPSGQIYFV